MDLSEPFLPAQSAQQPRAQALAPPGPRPRYALYFAPTRQAAFWDAGCRWLGYDALSGATPPPPDLPGVTPMQLRSVTAGAAGYGFHATLKAPFALAAGASEAMLLDMVAAFCMTQAPLALPDLQVRRLGRFLALCPGAPNPAVDLLAAHCVRHFDDLRAPPSDAELAKRRRAGLSARQEVLLQRWGYPYTEEQFRFHMTLSDDLARLDAATGAAVCSGAQAVFAEALRAAAPAVVDGLTVLYQPGPEQPFRIIAQHAFGVGDVARA